MKTQTMILLALGLAAAPLGEAAWEDGKKRLKPLTADTKGKVLAALPAKASELPWQADGSAQAVDDALAEPVGSAARASRTSAAQTSADGAWPRYSSVTPSPSPEAKSQIGAHSVRKGAATAMPRTCWASTSRGQGGI